MACCCLAERLQPLSDHAVVWRGLPPGAGREAPSRRHRSTLAAALAQVRLRVDCVDAGAQSWPVATGGRAQTESVA